MRGSEEELRRGAAVMEGTIGVRFEEDIVSVEVGD